MNLESNKRLIVEKLKDLDFLNEKWFIFDYI